MKILMIKNVNLKQDRDKYPTGSIKCLIETGIWFKKKKWINAHCNYSIWHESTSNNIIHELDSIIKANYEILIKDGEIDLRQEKV